MAPHDHHDQDHEGRHHRHESPGDLHFRRLDGPGSHEHVFLGKDHARNESRTWLVIGLTSAMMVAEILAGSVFGSMALLADGFHMATHAGALLIAALAYLYARRHARDDRFTFGTGKVGDLAAFASAIILAVIAVGIGYESIVTLYFPVPIRFGEAISVAVVGLVVNLASAFLLHQDEHGHGAHADHDHGHEHAHGDQNLRAAYLHVLADALTSVLAIIGLIAGWFYGWIWMDAVAGVLGSIVIARWSIGLLKSSGGVLLDVVPSPSTEAAIRSAIETGGDRVVDLHLWRVGPGHMAAVVSVASREPQPTESYRVSGLSHVNVEVLRA